MAEEAGCRSQSRQSDASGCDGKKELTLALLRDWVRDLQARYGASERQICFAYGSAAVRSGIVLLLPMTAHWACVYVKSSKRAFISDTAGYT